MSTREELLKLLNDQHFQSGSELGRRLGISRAAVQQHIAALRAARVPIETAARQGYRLAPGVSLLRPELIVGRLSTQAAQQVSRVEVLAQVDSTNNVLLRDEAMHGVVVLAEDQSGGRGRRTKRWCATPYRNLMLSVDWVFDEWPTAVTALGLVAALAATRALASRGIEDVGIKWPNDLIWQERKLGGILVDLVGEAGGNCRAVIGVGINVQLKREDATAIDQPWVDLAAFIQAHIDRNWLAAAVIDALVQALVEFPHRGFAAVSREWQQKHILQGQQVEIVTERNTLVARVEGVDPYGALLVREQSGAEHKFFHGEVSIRR